jgi:DNA-damage-inducible protein D
MALAISCAGIIGKNGDAAMSEPKDSKRLAEIAFGSAFKRKPKAAESDSLQNGAVERLVAAFEDAAQITEDGVEFWSARDLQGLLGYAKWDNFLEVVEKAKAACGQSGQPVSDHFADASKMVAIGSGAERGLPDVHLTRYAGYLTAQNGDSRKPPIAFAQTYFAIQTRRQEIQADDAAQYAPLDEDQKRLLLRDEIKDHNKRLASAAKEAGVIKPFDFAVFQTFGYKGLYGGLDRVGIQRRKGLRSKQQILDHMGSTELAANLFRATQTEDKLRRDKVKGKDAANATHYAVGRKVRKAIEDIGGTMPENLPPAEDIAKVARRIKKAIGSGSKRLK